MTRVEIYSAYERIWHWLQAAAILLLALTGFEIHAPDHVRLLGFAGAARLHEALALLLIANGFLSLFYHLATGAIRQYVPAPRDALTQGVQQVRYYLGGIFRGDPHPFARHRERKLNVLQQLTYLAILNVLLPVQIVTGVLLWQAVPLAWIVERLGGLGAVAAVHVGAAWLFLCFVVMHVYLTTTGPTPLAYLRAMITGHEAAHPEAHDERS